MTFIPPIRNVKRIKNTNYKTKDEYSKVCSQLLFPHFDIIILMSFCLNLAQVQVNHFLKVIAGFYVLSILYEIPVIKLLFPFYFYFFKIF